MKVTQRARFRYRRWQYEREMAMPAPPPRKETVGRGRRATRRVVHPLYYTRKWFHGREESKPPPPPMTQAELLGGPIKRTYRRFRIRLSHARHNFTNWPIAFQIVGILAAAAIIVGAFFGVKGQVFKKKNANLSAALAQAQDARSLIPGKKAGQRRVILAGDYSVINLANANGGNIYQSPQFEALLESAFGCTITNDTTLVAGKQSKYPDVCSTWPSTYADNAHFYEPDVSILMTGQGESAPQIVNGKTIRPGTPEFQQYLFTRLDVARKSLGGVKTPLVLVAPLCTLTPSGGLNLPLADVAVVWDRYAASHPHVTVANPSGLICPRGKPGSTSDGKPIRDKHGAFTKEGAAAMWNFILQAADRVA